MCKWCGTWFCKECLRGAFWGFMSEPLKCRVCFQKNCQGVKVDYAERLPAPEMNNKGHKTAGNPKAGIVRPSKGQDKTSKNKASKSGKAGGKAKKKKQR